MNQPESGFIGTPETDGNIGSQMRDIEVIRVSKTNVIARGRRYGRQWFLKGLREEFRDSTVMQRQLQKEFEIHTRLRHPAVPQLVGLENVEGLGLCIDEEWIDGASLHEKLQKEKMSAAEKRHIIHDITETVAYLHSRGIVHLNRLLKVRQKTFMGHFNFDAPSLCIIKKNFNRAVPYGQHETSV